MKLFGAIVLGLILLLSVSVSSGYELRTEYATVVYDKEELLRQFDKQVSLGSLSYLLRNRGGVTAADEVKNKIDFLVERVEAVLDMFPAGMRFRVILLPSQAEVRKMFRTRYGRRTDFIAFYSPLEQTVYISVDDARLGVVAHEFAHVVVNRYFGVSPPEKIHEVLAQFVETHLAD